MLKIPIIFFFLLNYCAYSQVRSSAYRGDMVEEYIWDKTKVGYTSVDKIPMTTKIIFAKEKIRLKKGTSDWRQNIWEFSKIELFGDKQYYVYYDERRQKILIDYNVSEIVYYYNWDIQTERHLNIATYRNLREDKSILDEFQKQFPSNLPSEKFRIDYNKVAFYKNEIKDWTDLEDGLNTFVININNNGDIMHIKANGKNVIYRKLSGVEKGNTSRGEPYQILKALDDDGDIFSFQIFNDPQLGLKMIYGNTAILFVKR